MRSGHYKLTCPKNGDRIDGEALFVGQFRTTYRELPVSAPPHQNGPLQFPLDLNTYHLSTFRRDDLKNERQEMMIRACREQMLKEEKRGDGIFRHRSCENVNFLSRGSVNRFEQKVRSLWLKGETRRRSESSFHNHNEGIDSGSSRMDHWQSGKIVTMPKKNRLLGAHSHSALNTLSTSSDTASCLSASSGYSSSSSSSYSSFKSSGSVGSTLPRHRNNSSGSQSPTSDNRILFVDNPLYDVSPASALHLDNPRFCEPSGQESLSSGEFSLGESVPSVPSLPEPFQDPLAKECKEFFEKRLEASENLRKKWSLYVPEQNIFEPDRNIDSELISKGDAIVDSKFNAGCEMSFGVESNFLPTDIIHLISLAPAAKSKTSWMRRWSF